MRRLVMWNLVTLDGFFEGPKSWDLDWHQYAWGDELEKLSLEQLKSADALLFGRVTYQGMASYWPTAKGESHEIADLMNGIPKIVFSTTLEKADWNNTKLVKENAEMEVPKLSPERTSSYSAAPTYVRNSRNESSLTSTAYASLLSF